MTHNNGEVVRRFYGELIAHGRIEAVDDLLSYDYVEYEAGAERRGPYAFAAWLCAFDRAFRNRAVVLDDVTADGDLVVARWSASLTHSRDFAGYAPTGRTFDVSGASVFRIEDGRIAEHWDHEDSPCLLRQLTAAASAPDHRFALRALAESRLAAREVAVAAG